MDMNFGQMGFDDLFSDLMPPASEPKKKSEKKEKKSTTAKVKEFELPIRAISRSMTATIDGNGKISEKELLEKIYDKIPESKAACFSILFGKNTAFVGFNKNVKASDKETILPVGTCIRDGEKVFQIEDEPEKLETVWEKFIMSFPEYGGDFFEPYYDDQSGLVIPIAKNTQGSSSASEISIIRAFGMDISVDEGRDLIDAAISEIGLNITDVKTIHGLNLSLSTDKYGDRVLVINCYNVDSSTSSPNTSAVKKSGVSKETYALPCTVFIATWGATHQLTPEQFDGKEKVTQEEISKFFSSSYQIFADKTRKASFIYIKETNTLSIAFTSGTKGACSFAETEDRAEQALSYGLFQLIRSASELEASLKEDSFYGVYVDERPGVVSQRIEVNTAAVYAAHLHEGKIVDVDWTRKCQKVSQSILDGIISVFRQSLPNEDIVQIWYSKSSDCFHVVRPSRSYKTAASVKYTMPILNNCDLFCTIHSHGMYDAFFSSIDDADENYTGLFGVIGNLDTDHPSMCFRCGVERHFHTVNIHDIFDI